MPKSVKAFLNTLELSSRYHLWKISGNGKSLKDFSVLLLFDTCCSVFAESVDVGFFIVWSHFQGKTVPSFWEPCPWLTWASSTTDKFPWEGNSGELSDGAFGPAEDSNSDSLSSSDFELEPESESEPDSSVREESPP